MNGITFAEPLFLYLLVVIPAMIAFYILKQQKATASLRMPDYSLLQRQEQHSDTISDIFFLLFVHCNNTSDYCSCTSTGN